MDRTISNRSALILFLSRGFTRDTLERPRVDTEEGPSSKSDDNALKDVVPPENEEGIVNIVVMLPEL